MMDDLLLVCDGAEAKPLQLQLLRAFRVERATAADAPEALRRKRPTLALLVLPPSDGGFLTLRQMHQADRATPVIALGGAADGRRAACLACGAADFLSAPTKEHLLCCLTLHARCARERRRADAALQSACRQIDSLRSVAAQDALTGLMNKRAFSAKTAALLGQNTPGALLVMDLDGLKYVNDTFGHAAGDRLICRFAALLRAWAGEGDLLCHLSGDEFAVFLPGVTAHDALRQKAAALLRQTLRHMATPDRSRVTTVSVGGAVAPEHGASYEVLFDAADGAMLRVKQSGKGDFLLCSASPVRRREAGGRQDCTGLSQKQLLRRREGEMGQRWIRFGEYRLLWQCASSLRAASAPASVLFTCRCAAALPKRERLAARMRDCLRAAGEDAIFAWYSQNQLLMLLLDGAGAAETAARIAAALEDCSPEDALRVAFEVQFSHPRELEGTEAAPKNAAVCEGR